MSYDEDQLPPRILAIDPGEKRVGLAISDPFGHFAVGLDTIQNHPGKNIVPEIQAVCQQYDVQQIVMGLPLHMSGQEGESAQKARTLGTQLSEALNLPVAYLDERLTSKIVTQSLREIGVQTSRNRQKGVVDQAAAMRILQDYLDSQKRKPI